MAINLQTTGAIEYSISNPAPVMPAHAAGDLIVMLIGTKPDTASAVLSDTGWTRIGGVQGGVGSAGNDTGPMRSSVYYKIAQSSAETVGTITIAGNSVTSTQILVFRKTVSAAQWDLAFTGAADTTTGSPHSAVMPENPGLTVGDRLLAVGVIPTDVTTPAQFSAQTVAATGMTTVSLTEINEWDTASGQDMGGWVAHGLVATGTATAAPTVSATAGGTTTNVAGPIMLFRMREGPVSASASDSGSISVDDIAAVVSAQLKRQNFNNTDGTTISVGNSSSSGDALDAVSISGTGATVTYSSTHALRGTAAARVAMPNWNNFGTLSLALPVALNNVYTQFYFKPISRPTEDAPVIAQYRNASGSTMADLRMGSNGTLSLRNSAGTTISTAPSGTIVLNSIYRVEVSIAYNGTGAVSTISYRIFDDTDTQVHFEAVPNQTVGNNGGMKSVAVGMITAQQLVTNFDVAFDELAISPNAIASIAPGPTNKTGSESTAISVADVASVDMGSTPIAGTESTAISVSDTAAIEKRFGSSDGAAISVADTSATEKRIAVTDTAAITITETSGKGSEFPGSDTSALSVTDTASVLVLVENGAASTVVEDFSGTPQINNHVEVSVDATTGNPAPSLASDGLNNWWYFTDPRFQVVGDFDISYDLNINPDGQAARDIANFGFWLSDVSTNPGTWDGYAFRLQTNANDGGWLSVSNGVHSTVPLARISNHSGALASGNGQVLLVNPNTWYRVRLVAVNGYVTATVTRLSDSALLLTSTADFATSGYSMPLQGTFGQKLDGAGSSSGHRWDNITLTDDTGETIALSVSESTSILKTFAVTDTTALTVTESTAIDSSLSRTDTAAITATDTAALFKTLTASDTASLAVTEVAGTANTQPGSETIAIGVTETASTLVTQTASDTSALTITDTRTTAASSSVTDTAAISVAESVNYEISLSRTDTAAITVNDTNTSFITKEATDTASIAVTETGNAGGESEPIGQESTALGIVETASILVTQNRTDTSAISVSDASATFLARAGTESVALSVTETRAQSVSVSVSDAAAISIGDTGSSFITLSRTDTASVTVNDISGFGTVGRPGSETTALAVTEQAAILVTQSVTDTAAVTLTDDAAVFVPAIPISASDTASIAVSESLNYQVNLSRTDGAAITVTEARAIASTLSRTDGAAISVSDVRVVLVPVSDTDSIAIVLADTGVKAEGTATPMVYQNGQWVVGTVVIYSEGEWRPAPVKVHRSGLWM